MGLLSIFKRKTEGMPAAAAAGETTAAEVAQARTRARRRLIGAVVLVAIGIVGFPIVFETQPRPIPVDIPIEIPKKDGAPPLAMPAARVALNGASAAAVVPEPDGPPASEVITEARADAGRDVPPPAAAAPTPRATSELSAPAEARPAPYADKPAEKAADKPAEKGADKSTDKDRSASAADGARAAALLEGKDVAKADASRFIVQIGAFAESNAAQEARAKIEKLGLKTYTQVAETPAGNRIRVRMGPFASRDDADKALAKAKAAGLSGVVLTL